MKAADITIGARVIVSSPGRPAAYATVRALRGRLVEVRYERSGRVAWVICGRLRPEAAGAKWWPGPVAQGAAEESTSGC